MDPNANLQEQEAILSGQLTDTPITPSERAELRDLRQALYDWIRDGGFEPDWSKGPNAARYYGH